MLSCSSFYDLLFRREWPFFLAFDVLSIDGDIALPLVQGKRRLARIMPRVESRLMKLDAIPAGGERLFALARKRDLEGIDAKWSKGTRTDGRSTSWLKIKNPDYSQMKGRRELFTARHGAERASTEGRTASSGAPVARLGLFSAPDLTKPLLSRSASDKRNFAPPAVPL